MKNSLTDVKNHLIAEMERLNDDEFVPVLEWDGEYGEKLF